VLLVPAGAGSTIRICQKPSLRDPNCGRIRNDEHSENQSQGDRQSERGINSVEIKSYLDGHQFPDQQQDRVNDQQPHQKFSCKAQLQDAHASQPCEGAWSASAQRYWEPLEAA
jgi:hypothetical protein